MRSFNFVIALTVLLAWKGCENGNFRFKGTVYRTDSGIRKPLDGIAVTVVREYLETSYGRPWRKTYSHEGTARTDVKGHYEIHGITPYAEKHTYYLVFEDPSYRTDTVKIRKKGSYVQSTYDHEMKPN